MPLFPFASRILVVLVAIYLLAHSNASAQIDRRAAEENPLSTAILLLSKTEKNDKEEEKACLAKSLSSVNRLDDVSVVVEMVERESYVDKQFVLLAHDLISKGKEKDASSLVSILLERFENDDGYYLKELIRPLILLKREAEIGPLLDKLEDPDEIDVSFEVAAAYGEVGNSQKALDTLKRIVSLVEASKYAEDKATFAFHYAKLGKKEEAIRFVRLALDSLTWISGQPEYNEGRVIDRAIETYRLVGKDALAKELVIRRGKPKEIDVLSSAVDDLVEDAERALTKGDPKKATEYLDKSLSSVDPKRYGDSFALGRIVEIYIKLGRATTAASVARSISGNEYMRQKMLLAVADDLVKHDKRANAFVILQVALQLAGKIDISEEEDGQLWTSSRWNQAGYEAKIALHLAKMRFDKQALQIISRIKKPYLKAQTLSEFVVINKKRTPSKNLSSFLDEGVKLLRVDQTEIFDSKRFDVFASLAHNFAEIGLTERSSEVFTEILTKLDEETIERGTDRSLIFGLCRIGVEFERSNIKANEPLKAALRRIISNWEEEKY